MQKNAEYAEAKVADAKAAIAAIANQYCTTYDSNSAGFRFEGPKLSNSDGFRFEGPKLRKWLNWACELFFLLQRLDSFR